MKKSIIGILSSLFFFAQMHGQDVTFTFANAEITNGGSCFETDVMIQSTAGFKLGSGQLYFNYNTSAFGTNVVGNSKLTVTRPSGSILATDLGPPFNFEFYNNFVENDNTTSRFSFSWQHAFSEGCLSGNNITGTAAILFHIKLEYAPGGSAHSPDLCFESGSGFDDQTFTACGPSGCTNADCGANPGTQITNDMFDCSGAVLPVELRYFSARLTKEKSVELNWETASEINVSHFKIERSTNGIDWNYLNDVVAVGESYLSVNYEYYDQNLRVSVGTNLFYYRLKMIDWDGFYEYSDIRNVSLNEVGLNVNIYPNPTQNDLYISVSGDFEEGDLVISDLKGRAIFRRTISLSDFPYQLSVSEFKLAAGIYNFSLISNGRQIIQKRIAVISD